MNDQALYDRLIDRIIERRNGCWIATSAPSYAVLGGCGKEKMAHRLMWVAKHGSIPDGLVVCHECDHPPCINPDHLWLGTRGQNQRDAARKGRLNHVRGAWCKQGHKVADSCPVCKELGIEHAPDRYNSPANTGEQQ